VELLEWEGEIETMAKLKKNLTSAIAQFTFFLNDG